MGTNYYAVRNRPSVEEPIHIGKSSAGWMFNFREQNDKWHEPPVEWHTFEQVHDWLKQYTVDTNEYVIMNEYDDLIDFDLFFQMIQQKQKQDADNPDNFRYCKNVNGYRFSDRDFC